jgi:hypothetical protein
MAIITTIIGALLFGLTLWGSIKLFDRYNSRNSLAVAAIIGGFFGFAAPALGLIFLFLPLIALMYLLVQYYELGLIRSVAVIGAMVAANIALSEIIAAIARLAT